MHGRPKSIQTSDRLGSVYNIRWTHIEADRCQQPSLQRWPNSIPTGSNSSSARWLPWIQYVPSFAARRAESMGTPGESLQAKNGWVRSNQRRRWIEEATKEKYQEHSPDSLARESQCQPAGFRQLQYDDWISKGQAKFRQYRHNYQREIQILGVYRFHKRLAGDSGGPSIVRGWEVRPRQGRHQ